jgi:hypothetical protein
MELEELWWRKKLQELQEAMILHPLLLQVPNLIEWLLDSIALPPTCTITDPAFLLRMNLVHRF